MAGRIALCIDEVSMRNPGIIGLEDELIELQPWLDVYASGSEARTSIARRPDTDEAWVISCDDVEPINLAASLKADNPDLKVSLVSSELCGSLLSRAHNALIDEVIEQSAFVRRYGEAKRNAFDADADDKSDIILESGIYKPRGSASSASRVEGAKVPSAEARREGPGESGKKASVEVSKAARREARKEARKEAGRGFLRKKSPQLASNTATAPVLSPETSAVVVPTGTPAAATAPSPEASAVVAPRPVEEFAAAPLLADELAEPPVERTLQVKAQPRPLAVRTSSRAFVLSVVSGSGGAGKSAVSALSALISRAGGRKTVLLDCDLQFGDVDAMVGVVNPLRIDEVLAQPDLLEREIAQDGRVSVLAAPARLETADEIVGHLPDLLEWVSDSFDVVVANTGAAWAEQHAALLERSSVALFLVDQRASSVRACKHALELCARCGIATGPFQFALNRCAKGAPLSSVDVSCALQGAPVFELKDGGRDVEDYLSSGAAADLLDMKNEFAKSLEQVMARLLPGSVIEADARVVSEPSRPLRRRRRGRK